MERLSRHRKVHSVADRLDAHSPSAAEKATVYHTVQAGDAVMDLVE